MLLKNSWKTAAIFFIFCSTLQMFGILVYGAIPHGERADAAVVLGSKVYPNGLPSKRLTTRLDAAVDLYKQKRVTYVIVSGATGKEGVNEAGVMANYLEQKGIPKEHILIDAAGSDTWESAKNTKNILKENHLIKTVAIVTSNFHILRSQLAFEVWGVPVTATRPAYFMINLREPYSLFREWGGIPAYALRGWFFGRQ